MKLVHFIQHPAIQVKSKHTRYIACEDFKSLMRWTVGIRLAKVYKCDDGKYIEITSQVIKWKASEMENPALAKLKICKHCAIKIFSD